MPDTQQILQEDVFDPRAFLGRIGAGKTVERYRKNQKIFGQGDIADTVFFIQKGKVKITVLSEHGKEAVVGIFGEGQFFGETCLRGGVLRSATSHAMEECLITSINLIDQLFNSSERRLARLLLLLANFGQENDAKPVAVTLSQETLAEMIGTTRSRVSFFMNKFRKKGFIDYNGKIEVHRSLLNAVLRDKPQIREEE